MYQLTQEDTEKLVEIQRLLDEGLEHYLTYESHCKSSEGYVSVNFGNSWERRDGENPVRVSVYSYVLGPHRSHEFDSIDEALEEVKKWHADEMSFTPDEDYQDRQNHFAKEVLQALGDKLTIVEVDGDREEDEQ